jgi:hypothetical protein
VQFSGVFPFFSIYLRWITQQDAEPCLVSLLYFTTRHPSAAAEEDSIDDDCEEEDEEGLTSDEFGDSATDEVDVPGPEQEKGEQIPNTEEMFPRNCPTKRST